MKKQICMIIKTIIAAGAILAALFMLTACARVKVPDDVQETPPAGTQVLTAPTEKQTAPETTPEVDETVAPTDVSADAPTGVLTDAPTDASSPEPAAPTTPLPTPTQTQAATAVPTLSPTSAPTKHPTATPTNHPTDAPTDRPTATATAEPEKTPEVDENGMYTTENGKKYTVTGQKQTEGATFTIKDNFVITFADGSFKEDFNRMSFTYSSGAPLKMYVKYVQSGKEKSDYYFLEAGENATFRGLISSYLDSASAKNIKTLTLSSLKSDTAFSLKNVSTEKIAVYNSNNHFIENSRFKVGIQLSWGGGINYIEDKTCKISGLTNLVNRCDTGRLIQQSYYGTGGNKDYTPGEFNGSKWSYNPVQGGDKYGNVSRLIDIEVSSNSVYIKAQPQDWSLNGRITPSYMENRYTLNDDYVRVDNRFVDFSGWEHRYSHQELPAFYTVSYLDTFKWYSGAEGWTGGDLSIRKHLNFWGDPNYAEDCRFYVQKNNTETWCAWVSSKDDFGMGLYVPNIDMLYAGRFSYNGSKDPMNGATNYVAPLMTIKMVSFVPIEYSYLVTTGSTEAIRATFTANKDFADNASLHKNYQSMRVASTNYAQTDEEEVFIFADPAALVTNLFNTSSKYDKTEQAMRFTVSEPHDPQIMLDYNAAGTSINAKDYKYLDITYKIPETASRDSYECDLFLCTGSKTSPDGSERTRITLERTGKYETVRVDLSALSFWSGAVNAIRFDYFDSCEKGDYIFVKEFKLTN
ncbi:MAG: PT domain-containing protein [Clostridia bacterium]|nr:PT domain-containing protein [Clostridia bacterium]